MDPATLALLISAVGGLTSAVSPLFAEEVTPQNINQEQTDQFTQLLQSLLGQNQNQLDQSLLDASRTQGQISGVASKQGALSEQLGNLEVPQADDWFDQFTQKFIPAFQNIALQTAEAGTRSGSAQERANRASQQGATAALDQFAGQGAFSGAAVNAATEAAVNPQLEYLSQVDQQFGSLFGQTFNQLAGQGQQLAFQGSQNEFLNNLSKLQGQLGALGGQSQSLGQILQGSLGQAGQLGGQQQNLLGQLGQLSQPTYATPSFIESPAGNVGQAIGGLGSLLSQYQSNQQSQDNSATLQEILKKLTSPKLGGLKG